MTPKTYSARCGYCGRFLSWPYPPVGLEWHDHCEKMELRRQFEREALGRPVRFTKREGAA